MGATNTDWRTLYHSGGNDDSYQTIVHTPDNSVESLWANNNGAAQNSGYAITTGDNGWHMLTTVGNASAGWTKFYIDGTYVGRRPGPARRNIWSIGARGGDNAQQFANYLDDFTFYQQSLSASQVAQLYQAAASTASTLPATSPVNITSGMLDVEGANQLIGPLTGSTSASINLGRPTWSSTAWAAIPPLRA